MDNSLIKTTPRAAFSIETFANLLQNFLYLVHDCCEMFLTVSILNAAMRAHIQQVMNCKFVPTLSRAYMYVYNICISKYCMKLETGLRSVSKRLQTFCKISYL